MALRPYVARYDSYQPLQGHRHSHGATAVPVFQGLCQPADPEKGAGWRLTGQDTDSGSSLRRRGAEEGSGGVCKPLWDEYVCG